MRRRALLAIAALLVPGWAWGAPPPAEQARIERLIRFVETLPQAKFVRDNAAYAGQDAAKFLRGKYARMGEHVNTAQQFIDQIASTSSTTGKAYLIRNSDGREVPIAQVLGDELVRIDAMTP